MAPYVRSKKGSSRVYYKRSSYDPQYWKRNVAKASAATLGFIAGDLSGAYLGYQLAGDRFYKPLSNSDFRKKYGYDPDKHKELAVYHGKRPWSQAKPGVRTDWVYREKNGQPWKKGPKVTFMKDRKRTHRTHKKARKSFSRN